MTGLATTLSLQNCRGGANVRFYQHQGRFISPPSIFLQ
jgi:hypothetical protein